MKNVLFYGDSNTWGYQGDNPMHRLDADKRYTGVVAAQFPDVHFIEEGLCGRTICSTDPIDYGRNGMSMLPALLATHDPLDVIVIMLGTNDSKAMYGHSPFTISDATMALAAEHKPAGAGYHIHVAEGIDDLHDCLKKHSKRIVDRLKAMGREDLL